METNNPNMNKIKERENLSEMISVSFTPTQSQSLENATAVAGFDKVGTYARWIIVQFLKENGFLKTQAPTNGDE